MTPFKLACLVLSTFSRFFHSIYSLKNSFTSLLLIYFRTPNLDLTTLITLLSGGILPARQVPTVTQTLVAPENSRGVPVGSNAQLL